MNTEIADALEIKTEGKRGIVILYKAYHHNETIKELCRSKELPFMIVLYIFAETPNPASQLLTWSSEEEKEQVLKQHALDIKDPKWLDNLFECI